MIKVRIVNKKLRLPLAVLGASALLISSCRTDDGGDDASTSTHKPFSAEATTEATTEAEPSGPITLDKDSLQEVSSSNFSSHDRVRFSAHLDGSFVECVKGDGYATCNGKPDDSIPDAENPPFSGRPNEIAISASALYYNIGEGGPPGAKELQPGQWIQLGVADCGLPDESTLICESEEAAFEISGEDRDIRTSGTVTTDRSFYSTASQEAIDNGTSYGQDQDVLVTGPMMCGAASGPRLAEVIEGQITCQEAMDVLDHYESIREKEGGGNTLMTGFDGWTCSSPTAARSQETNASAICHNPDRGVQVNAPL